MGNEKWKPEFVKEMCARFAAGESIDELADSTGNEAWEIEGLLKENAAVMEKAIRRMEAAGGAGVSAGAGGAPVVGTLHRIAAAAERIAAAAEQIAQWGMEEAAETPREENGDDQDAQ